jgi:hypothetical protein
VCRPLKLFLSAPDKKDCKELKYPVAHELFGRGLCANGRKERLFRRTNVITVEETVCSLKQRLVHRCCIFCSDRFARVSLNRYISGPTYIGERHS